MLDYGILVTTRYKKVTIKPQESVQIKDDQQKVNFWKRMTSKNNKNIKKSDENKKLKTRIETTSTKTTVKPSDEELATKMRKEEKIGENWSGVSKTQEKAANIDQKMLKGTSPVGKTIRKNKGKEKLAIQLLKKLEKPSIF